jgi:hypothetical protein
LGSGHDANNSPHNTQLAWPGRACAVVDSAIRYSDPQDGQIMSDIFMQEVYAALNTARIVLNQRDLSNDASTVLGARDGKKLRKGRARC